MTAPADTNPLREAAEAAVKVWQDAPSGVSFGAFMERALGNLSAALASEPVAGTVREVKFGYTNYRRETSYRRAQPISIRYGSSEYHKTDQWLMLALDLEKNEQREFAMRDMILVEGADALALSPQGDRTTASAPDRSAEFVMWALMNGSWQGADIDGGAAQDKAVELGLIVATAYDPEKHGQNGDPEPGDAWFVPSDTLVAALEKPTPPAPGAGSWRDNVLGRATEILRAAAYGQNIQTSASQILDEIDRRPLSPAPGAADRAAVPVEIRRNDDQSIDEICIDQGNVHIEQMDDSGWYMGVEAKDGSYWQFWFGAKNRKSHVEFRHTETSPAEAEKTRKASTLPRAQRGAGS